MACGDFAVTEDYDEEIAMAGERAPCEGASESERERVRERERESKRERWKICIFDYSMQVCRASTSMLLLTSLDSLALPAFLRDIPTSEALHQNEKNHQSYFRNIYAHDERCETVSLKSSVCIYCLRKTG